MDENEKLNTNEKHLVLHFSSTLQCYTNVYLEYQKRDDVIACECSQQQKSSCHNYLQHSSIINKTEYLQSFQHQS